MIRAQVGDDVTLGVGDDHEIVVHVARSLGWAELLEVDCVPDAGAATAKGVIAVKPDGTWWWVRPVASP